MKDFLLHMGTELVSPYYHPFTSEGLIKPDYDIPFIEGFAAADNTTLPLEYVKSSFRLLLMYEKQVKGGVLFQENSDLFRTRKLIPQGGPPQLVSNHIEMNGLWLDNYVSEEARVGFWCIVCSHLFAKYKDDLMVVFSYDTRKAALSPFYEWIAPRTIYEGYVPNLEGMDQSIEAKERVCYGTVGHFKDVLPYFVARRLKKKRNL